MAGIVKRDDERGDDLLDILREELESTLRSLGSNDRAARDIVASYIERVQLRAGGDRYWIPHRRDLLRRIEQIVAAFDGKNHDELCHRYGLTRRTLRRYLAYWKKMQEEGEAGASDKTTA